MEEGVRKYVFAHLIMWMGDNKLLKLVCSIVCYIFVYEF